MVSAVDTSAVTNNKTQITKDTVRNNWKLLPMNLLMNLKYKLKFNATEFGI